MRVLENLTSIFVRKASAAAVAIALFAGPVSAAVIFQDNFDAEGTPGVSTLD